MFNGNFENKALSTPGAHSNSHAASRSVDGRSTGSQESSSASFWDYWRLAKRGKYWLLTFGLLGCVAGFIDALLQQPVYMATTTIELQGFNESFMGMNAVDPQAGAGNYVVNTSNINTEIKIIQSASVRSPVIERLARETTPVVPPARTSLDKLRQRLRRAPMDPLKEMRNGLGMAVMTVKAKPVTGTRIIAVSCESTIPEIASNFVNTLAVEYIAQNTQQRSTRTQKTSQWLESQLEEVKVRLVEAEGKLEDFVKKSGVVYSGEADSQNVLTSSKLRQLTSDLTGIQAEVIASRTKYNAVNDMIKKKTPDQIPEIADNPILRTLESKLAETQKKYNDLRQTYTAENKKVIPVQNDINELQAEIQKERTNILQRIKDGYDQVVAKEEGFRKAYLAEASLATSQQAQAATYNVLKREVLIYQQTLNMMLQQVNQASVVAAVPTNNIRVLDQATPAGMPFKPDVSRSLETYGSAGMAVGFGLVFLKERAAKRKSALRFGVPGYAPSVMAVPELGVIPSGEFVIADSQAPRGRWKRMKAPAILPPETAGGVNGLALSGWQGKPSLLAESFRLTMTSLMLMFRNSPRVLVVTSPGPGEGKTTISANLAMAMAEAGKKVLVVDMDLRRPKLHTMFNVPNERGFTDLVRGDDLPLRITENHPAIASTAYHRISVLSSGHIEINDIGEVFHSPRVPGLLRQLRECFDMVIIDTPPMLQFSESRLAASFADGVLLVLRSGRTDRESAMAAREQLAHDGIELLGTILNDWDPRQTGAASQYGSYYASYMKYHSKEEV